MAYSALAMLRDRDVGVGVFPEGGVCGTSALALPDAHAVGWREVEFVSGFDIECRIPRVEVAYGIYRELIRGMLVGHHCLPKIRVSRL